MPSRRSVAAYIAHPGIKVNVSYLTEHVRKNLEKEPWKSAFQAVLTDPFARSDRAWKAAPVPEVECGPYSKPDIGCTSETNDAQAAYTMALLWVLTQDSTYAEASINILDAWSSTLVRGHSNTNAPLQAAWSAAIFTAAAEIIKHTDTGWVNADRFTMMLQTQFRPIIETLFSASKYLTSNWEATGIEALCNIGVFCGDSRLIAQAFDLWRCHLPAYIYLVEDGPLPLPVMGSAHTISPEESHASWHAPMRYVNGMARESCRDFEHTAYGLASFINTAETALMQGVNLYEDVDSNARERLTKTLEFHAQYQNLGPIMPKLCRNYDGIKASTRWTFEIAYTHYVTRLGLSLPHTRQFLQRHRPAAGNFHYLWETLTHAYEPF